jgi:hypothetical protein
MSNTFNIKRTETNGDGVALNSVAHPKPTSKIDVIIDALEGYFDNRPLGLDKMHQALAAAHKLKTLKPVAWVTQRTGDGGRVLDGFETCDFDDYGAIPVYALDEVTK